MKDKLNKINNKWVRLTVFIIVSINSALMMAGYELLPFDNGEIVMGLSIAAMVINELWNHWKNNSYTGKAKQADNYLESIKKGEK